MAGSRKRPIVAELGRPETPQEQAERRANARRERRANQNLRNLFGAVIASLLIAGFFGLLMTSPGDEGGVDEVDYAAIAADAQHSVKVPLAAPQLDEGWRANRAGLSTGADGVTVWRIGFVTPDNEFLGLKQGIDANPSWLAAQLENARETGSVLIEGVRWRLYDQREVRDAGNLTLAMSSDAGDSTFVLYGTAGDDEFRTMAIEVTKASTR